MSYSILLPIRLDEGPFPTLKWMPRNFGRIDGRPNLSAARGGQIKGCLDLSLHLLVEIERPQIERLLLE